MTWGRSTSCSSCEVRIGVVMQVGVRPPFHQQSWLHLRPSGCYASSFFASKLDTLRLALNRTTVQIIWTFTGSSVVSFNPEDCRTAVGVLPQDASKRVKTRSLAKTAQIANLLWSRELRANRRKAVRSSTPDRSSSPQRAGDEDGRHGHCEGRYG